jgi:hypothetical protein
VVLCCSEQRCRSGKPFQVAQRRCACAARRPWAADRGHQADCYKLICLVYLRSSRNGHGAMGSLRGEPETCETASI